MTVDELIQTIRCSSLHSVRLEIEKVFRTDHVFYEKLCNLFERAKVKSSNEDKTKKS